MTTDVNTDQPGGAERIRWPDGPMCPYCGERERIVAEQVDGQERLRYECPACEIHRGYFRRPGSTGKAPEGAPKRRPIVPRFPGPDRRR